MVYCDASVCEETDVNQLTNDELLELDVDVLVLAALENAITTENADKVKASTILEIANGPVTASADPALEEDGIVVLPDVLVNAGGVIVSYLEWVQNRAGDYWPGTIVEKRLTERLDREANLCFDRAEEKKLPLRTAAYMQGIARISDAMDHRGTRTFFANSPG